MQLPSRNHSLNFVRELEILGVHAEGEIGRIITSGHPEIPGASMIEKMDYINDKDDEILRLALYEPRGAAQMTINLLVPAISKHADVGFIPLQADGAHAMSGSNAICITTALLETGMLEMSEPETTVRLDTPAGLIQTKASCKNGKVENVEIEMPISFVEHLNHALEVESVGTIYTDVAFGGCYFVLVDAKSVGFEIAPHEARDLVDMGAKISRAAAEQIKVQHPEIETFDSIEYPMFVTGSGDSITNATIIFPGRLDRSPCGTGTAARLAVMVEKGEIGVNQTVSANSIVGGEFTSKVASLTSCGLRNAVKPIISGRAWIYGKFNLGVHPTDPFPLGFTLSDVWGTGTPR